MASHQQFQASYSGTLLSEWWNRTALKCNCAFHSFKVIFLNYFFVRIMKIVPSFLLADVMDMRSGSPQPCSGNLHDKTQGKHSRRFPKMWGRSLGHSSHKDVFEMRSVHIISVPLQHDKFSEGSLDLHWLVDRVATWIIQATLNWI